MNLFLPGKRNTGTDHGWKGVLPEGVKEHQSPTSLVWILDIGPHLLHRHASGLFLATRTRRQVVVAHNESHSKAATQSFF
jgi:hypothetical protein